MTSGGIRLRAPVQRFGLRPRAPPQTRCLAVALLPTADDFARWVAERRNPEFAFRIRRLNHRAAVGGDAFQDCVNAVDVDVWQDPRLLCCDEARYPGTDHVTRRVSKADVISTASANLPAKHLFIEPGRLVNINRWYLDVRQAAVPKQVLALHVRATAALVVVRH